MNMLDDSLSKRSAAHRCLIWLREAFGCVARFFLPVPDRLAGVFRWGLSCLVFSLGVAVHADEAGALVKRFQDGANKWADFVDRAHQITEIRQAVSVQAEVRVNGVMKSGGETTVFHTIRTGDEFVQFRKATGRDLTGMPDIAKQRYAGAFVDGLCKDYAFRIADYHNKNEWAIEGTAKDSQFGTAAAQIDHGVRLPVLEMPFTVLDPSQGIAVVVSAREVVGEPPRSGMLVAVDFKFVKDSFTLSVLGKTREIDLKGVSKCSVVFDPAKEWLPVSCSIVREQLSSLQSEEREWSYLMEGGKPIHSGTALSSFRLSKDEVDHAKGNNKVEWEVLSNKPFPESRFRLPFYGLSEPDFATLPKNIAAPSQGLPSNWLLIISGIALPLAGFYLGYRMQPTRSPSQSPSSEG